MRVAIPFWVNRVSPVFDVAKQLLLVDVENSVEVTRREKTIDETDLLSRVSFVADLGVELLICGAISRPLRRILEARGVAVIGQVCGEIEEILKAFLRGKLNDRTFLMPGCQKIRPIATMGAKVLNDREPYMRVAVTSQGSDLGSQVDPRFGRARYLIVIDTETGEFDVLDNSRNLSAVQGAGIQTAKDVVNAGADTVLTGQVGPKALEALEIARVRVFTGASGTVEEALKQLRSGSFKSISGLAAT